MIITRNITIWPALKKRSGHSPIITDVDKWLDKIKNPDHNTLYKIQKIRGLDKTDPEFNKLKSSLPVAQLNGSFPQRKENSVQALSGLAYLDIDTGDIPSIRLSLASSPYVYAYWTSVSGRGLGILVRYSNPNNTQFNNVLSELAIELDIPIDNNAKGLARTNFLSYDPDLYHNPKAIEYEIKSKETVDLVVLKNNTCSIGKSTLSYTTIAKTKLTLDHYPEPVVFIEKPFFQAYWPYDSNNGNKPKTIREGDRHKTIGTFIHNLVLLNPDNPPAVRTIVHGFNKHYCQPPVEFYKIDNWIDWHYANIADLKPYKVRMKKIWVDPSLSNKLQAIGQAKEARSIQAIEDVLSYLLCGERKITVAIISRQSGIGRKTIYKYIKYYKEEIDQFNSSLKKQ